MIFCHLPSFLSLQILTRVGFGAQTWAPTVDGPSVHHEQQERWSRNQETGSALSLSFVADLTKSFASLSPAPSCANEE